MEKRRLNMYRDAVEAVKAHRFKDAFELYCSLFLPLTHKTTEFRCFYRYQLATYLTEKKNYSLSLPEGDMVSDLIEMVYDETICAVENSDIPISDDGRINILESIEITFPCQKETMSPKRPLSVAE